MRNEDAFPVQVGRVLYSKLEDIREWITTNIGPRETKWNYSQIFGYTTFYFHSLENQEKFKQHIDTTYFKEIEKDDHDNILYE